MKSAAERFRRLVDKVPGLKADAYYWCSGKTWETRRYCVVLTVKHRTICEGIELRADTPQELAAKMREEGYPAKANGVARMCHAARLSPKRPRSVGT